MNIARRKPLTARVGIFGVGLDTYWEQFPGLLDDLLAKKEILKRKLSAHSVELFDFGMVDNAERAAAALPQIEAARERMVSIKLMVRVLHDMKQISTKQFALTCERMESVSKQLAAWQKYMAKDKSAGGRREKPAEVSLIK